MKSKAYMDELRMKDAQELENELMAAKKELFYLNGDDMARLLLEEMEQDAKEGK